MNRILWTSAYLEIFLFGLFAWTTPSRAQWQVYEGFDYRTTEVEGADGGAGSWVKEWRKSARGGCVLDSKGLTYRDIKGQSLKVKGGALYLELDDNGGAYRDVIAPGKDGAVLVIWCSFLMEVQGGPFTSPGDEVALQLRNKKDVALVTVGVMGRLNQWRVRVENSSKQRAYSKGAEGVKPEEVHWIVCRIKADVTPDASDSVHLWIDPALDREPTLEQATVVLDGEDWWGESDGLDLHRVRVGALHTDGLKSKKMKFDELRIGLNFVDVASVEGK